MSMSMSVSERPFIHTDGAAREFQRLGNEAF